MCHCPTGDATDSVLQGCEDTRSENRPRCATVLQATLFTASYTGVKIPEMTEIDVKVKLVIRIWEMLGLNLGRHTRYPAFFTQPPGQWQDTLTT
jgi:hypothetical protein